MPRVLAQVATAATTEVAVNATAYTEQTTGAQRSIKSSSANDAAAGTGARTVKLIYFTLDATTGKILGPFTETITLNGTTAVATVAEDIALVERLEVVTAGSGGVAAGTITFYDDAAGAGAAITSIAAAAVRTFLGHHYVASGRLCRIVDVEGIGGDAGAALLQLKVKSYPSGPIEQPVTGQYGATLTLPRGVSFPDAVASPIPGPARIRLLVTPGNTNAQTTRASFGYTEEQTKLIT